MSKASCVIPLAQAEALLLVPWARQTIKNKLVRDPASLPFIVRFGRGAKMGYDVAIAADWFPTSRWPGKAALARHHLARLQGGEE